MDKGLATDSSELAGLIEQGANKSLMRNSIEMANRSESPGM